MAAPYHLIEEKAEQAFAAALLTEYAGTRDSATGLISGGALDGVYLFRGFDLLDIALPYISIVCDESGPNEEGLEYATGNQVCKITAQVCHQHNDTTRDGHSQIVGYVRDMIYASNLKDLMNAEGITDFTATRIYPGQGSRGVEDGRIITGTELMVKCRPS